MKKLNKWLASLFAVQLLVAGGLMLGANSHNGEFSSEPLLAVSAEQVDEIIISSADSSITLRKQGDQWRVDSGQGYPAAQQKLTGTLTQLIQQQTRWPVATTKSAHSRFSVTEQDFEKKVQLFDGDNAMPVLYFGSSPGFKQTHVRVEKQDEVYALNINAYDFPAKLDDWLDRSLLAVSNVTKVKADSYLLRKDNSDWLITSPDESETWTADVQKASELSRAMENLKVSGVAEAAPNFESAVAAGDVVSLLVEGDTQRTLQLLNKDNKYYVREKGNAQVFTLSSYDYNRLAGIESSDLIVASVDSSNAASDNAEQAEAEMDL